MKSTVFKLFIATASAIALHGCATISEDACLSGSWQDIGFQDGEKGRSRSRLADIAETCAKYGVMPDRVAYIRGLEDGLKRYCTPDTGFTTGRNGSAPNAECEAGGFTNYLDGYADGYDVYQLYAERESLVSDWNDRRDKYLDVTARLDAVPADGEDGLTAPERRRLERRAVLLADEMDDIRIDIRALERLHGLDRWTPPDVS